MTAEEIQGVTVKLTEAACKLIAEMGDGERVFPLRDIASDASITLATARKALSALKMLGLTQTGPLFNEEGLLRGRGTWLNRDGLALRAHLMKDTGNG